MYCIPQYRRRVGVPKAVSGITKLICQSCLVRTQVPRRYAPDDAEHERGVDLGHDENSGNYSKDYVKGLESLQQRNADE